MTGTLTLAITPDGVRLKRVADISDYSWLVQMSVLSGHSIFILDGQHRSQALRDLWKEVIDAVGRGEMEAEEVAQLLGRSSVPVMLILEADKNEISRMFVTMASTKAISPSLIAVMDREQFANRVGLEVAQQSELLAGAERLAYQTSTATGETIYAAAAIRAATANLFIGFRDRTPEMREENLREVFEDQGKDTEDQATVEEAAAEVVDLIDYAYERIPGWRELRAGSIEPKEFRSNYVHGTSSGLYVIAGAICAARLTSGVDPKHVIDLMGDEVSWERETRVSDGDQFVHPDFEGSLVVTEPQLDEHNSVVGWRTRTAGGARTNYEKATRQVIDKLINIDSTLVEMRSDPVQVAMGLKAGGKRGRPPKK